MSRVYVYALVEQRRRPLTILQHKIEFAAVGAMHAAIERLEQPPDLAESALRLQHRIVVALARKSDPILPARFGAMVEIDELERILRLRPRQLTEAFDAVRHKEQMTVRIFGPQSRPQASPGASTGAEYLRVRRDRVQGQVPQAAAPMRAALRDIASAERVDAGVGRIRVALHHLIERGRADEYRAIVDRFRSSLPHEDEVVLSGPWPPFAFTPDIWS